MKTCLFSILILSAQCCLADNSSYVTVTTDSISTNATIQILNGQTAEIISASEYAFVQNLGSTEGAVEVERTFSVAIQKNDITIRGFPRGSLVVNNGGNSSPATTGTTVAGPANIMLDTPNRLLTVKITPIAYNPNKTLIIPPGTNQVQITLQVSPDLVNWTPATNGIYGSPNTAQFFRISEVNLVSP